MNEIHCSVIQDLLPLYHDGVCSEETADLIEIHLANCNKCEKELENLHATIEIPPVNIQSHKQDEKMIRKMASSIQKMRKKAIYKGMGIAALICLCLFGAYYSLFEWNIQKVKSEHFNISNVAQLSNGHIVYDVVFTDKYDVMRVKYSLDEKGNFYMTPLRPILKTQTDHPIGDGQEEFNLEDMPDGKEITALYYGSPDDAILIWKKGIPLPKASVELEKNFDMKEFK